MPRYFIRLSFDGTAFNGWQIQHNAVSVQQVLQNALSTVLRHDIKITGAGRTDTGVHAKEYFAHFDIETNLGSDECHRIMQSLNGLLPKDIAIQGVFPVAADIHARFSAVSRTYQYLISRSKDPFLVNRAWFNCQHFDIDLMNQGTAVIMEYSQFSCFSKSNTQAKTSVCSVSYAKWNEDKHLLVFTITANRFLRNMVRAIVGTLSEVGREKISIGQLRTIIESGDRKMAGPSVPAEGLYLVKIEYPHRTFKSDG